MSPVTLALIGLAFTVAVQIATTAFIMGGLFNRVRQLERAHDDRVDLKSEMAELKATVSALGDRVTEFKADNHEALRELNHVIRNRLMTAQVRDQP